MYTIFKAITSFAIALSIFCSANLSFASDFLKALEREIQAESYNYKVAGGKTPKETLKRIITAINDNDFNAFQANIAPIFWQVTVDPSTLSRKERQALAFVELLNTVSTVSRISMRTAVSDGTFASSNSPFRKEPSPSPFLPDVLESAEITQKDDKIAIVTCSGKFSNGNPYVENLGLVNTDAGWIVVLSTSANVKGAQDRVQKLLPSFISQQQLQNVLAEPLARVEAALIEGNKEKFLEATSPFVDLISRSFVLDTYDFKFEDWDTVKLSSKALWDEVAVSLALAAGVKPNLFAQMDNKPFKEKDIQRGQAMFKEVSKALLQSQVVWTKDNMALLKLTAREFKIHRDDVLYWLVKSEKGTLTSLGASRTGGGYTRYFPFLRSVVPSDALPFSIEKYMETYAEHAEDIFEKVADYQEEREDLDKNIHTFIKNVAAALEKKDLKKLQEYMDIPLYLSDNGNLQQVALALGSPEQKQQIIDTFAKSLAKGLHERDALALFPKAHIVGAVPHMAILKSQDGDVYVLQSKDEGDTWKLVRVASNWSVIHRPANWEAQISKQQKGLTAVFDNIKAFNTIWQELRTAFEKKDAKTFEKHVDIVNFLRNMSDPKATAVAKLNYGKNNGDVKAFMQSIEKGESKNELFLQVLRDVKTLPLSAKDMNTTFFVDEKSARVHVTDGLALEFERKDADSPWKITRQAKDVQSLLRSADYDAQVTATMQELEKYSVVGQELQTLWEELRNAVQKKDSAAFEKHVALLPLLRDTSEDLDKAIMNTKIYGESNADVADFMAQITNAKHTNKLLQSLALGKKLDLRFDVKHVRDALGENAARVGVQGVDLALQFERKDNAWRLIRMANNRADVIRDEGWEARYAKAVQDVSGDLAAMRKEMSGQGRVLAEALIQKNAAEIPDLIDIPALALCPNFSCDVQSVQKAMRSQLAPAGAFSSVFNEAVSAGKPLAGYEVLWDASSFARARYDYFSAEYPDIIKGTLLSRDGEQYILFAKMDGAIKLITKPIKDAKALAQISASKIQAWRELNTSSAASPAQQGVAELATFLRQKKGKEAVARLNYGAILATKEINDTNNEEAQASWSLFPTLGMQRSLQNMQASVEKNGSMKVKNVVIDAETLEKSTVYETSDNLVYLALPNNKGAALFHKEEGVVKLVALGPQLQERRKKDIPYYFNRRQKDVAYYAERIIKSTAQQTAVAAVLDQIKLENLKYTVTLENGSMTCTMDYVMRNTFTQPVKVNYLGWHFTDARGYDWLEYHTSIRNTDLAPGEAVRSKVRFRVGEKTAYLLDKVRKGEMRLMASVYRLQIGKYYFERYNKNGVVKPAQGGKWQILDYAPITPKRQWSAAPKSIQDKMWAAMAQHKAQSLEKAGQLSTATIDKLQLKYDAGKNTLTTTNTLRTEVRSVRYQLQVLDDQGIIYKERTQSWSRSDRILPGKSSTQKFKKPLAGKGERVRFQVQRVGFNGYALERGEQWAPSGFVSPILAKGSNMYFTLSMAEAMGTNKKTPEKLKVDPVARALAEAKTKRAEVDQAQKDAQKKQEESKKPEAPKTSPATAPTVSTDPMGAVAPAPKKPGVAVIVPSKTDHMGLKTFGADNKPDSQIRVVVQNASPLVGMVVQNMGGTAGSWKTKEAKGSALGVLLVQQGAKVLNAKDTAFSLDVAKPVILDLFMQDNGAIADQKTRMRVVFFYKDGTRAYALIKK